MKRERIAPDYIFEVSWEICNKVGGIHTVISTKAITLQKKYGDNYILIGPDVLREGPEHPEFAEDKKLLAGWKQKAFEDGLRVRVGRWKIAGSPLVFLLDFTSCFARKDEIFSSLWEDYKLNSISGGWDYIEPSLFGYGSARLIESYVKFHLTSSHKVVAQFHEWMTGAGLLYLKKSLPQLGTVFTTHATVIGRSIAGNNQPLYSKMKEYDGNAKATEFNVVSKQSMEKICANNADAFTTVSELTSHECAQFHEKEVDIITPNGFEDSFVPTDDFDTKRADARETLLNVSGKLLGEKLPDDSLIVANSGRYEYKNKGIDLFIDALGKLNSEGVGKRNILALILIPANHYGARKDLLESLKDGKEISGNKLLTHYLHSAEHDPIINRIRAAGLENRKEDKVKIIFVPSYLQGDDGIFNKSYYDLLIGMDLTVFPSYYEPWGYTPLESLAFHIPTVTTTLAGFGLWVKDEYSDPGNGIFVLNRNDHNDSEVTEGIAASIMLISELSKKETEIARKTAFNISRIALWENLIEEYKKAFSIALYKADSRSDSFVEQDRAKYLPYVKDTSEQKPSWKKLVVHQNLPKKLKMLEELSMNLWWSWNEESIALFESIDNKLWIENERNPILLLDSLSFEQIEKLEKDNKFIQNLEKVYSAFREYMDSAKYDNPEVAYFSMEFGLQESLKIYSGGLGLLAGDYLKEASDFNYNVIGVGLLYHYGYFTQIISSLGEQITANDLLNFASLPITPVKDENGKWKQISLALPGRDLKARVWRVDVGRVKLYLLDTDFDENLYHDRFITHQLYGGDNENRLKQELLLGIGGIRALRSLGFNSELYHCNEGHAAFISLERLREYINNENLTYPEALEVVRSSTLFTTHTPVPAGHDYFDENLMRAYISHYPERLKISWERLIDLGKMHTGDHSEKFSMSCLAVNLSGEVNGVSRLHGRVSKKMFADMWSGYLPEEVPIGYVTNGVHLPTWVSKRWREYYKEKFDKDFLTKQEDRSLWAKVKSVDQSEIWNIRNAERKDLVEYLKMFLLDKAAINKQNPSVMSDILEKLDHKILTIGFARRFATYKRAQLLFRDLDRLDAIVNNPAMPVQFLFAGKAHPRDKAGQDLIKFVVNISQQERFRGKILFIENYEIGIAKRLIQGVDIWMNTPTRPLEASGTSGEKVVMNGGLHFSVLDGWWAEGYVSGGGWALHEDRVYDNQDFQDQLDADTIYSLIEDEITPLFYKRNEKGVPIGWINVIQKSISEIAPEFTMNRMLRDYIDRFYTKLHARFLHLSSNNYKNAQKLAAWKSRILQAWDDIEVVEIKLPDSERQIVTLGAKYSSEVIINLKSIPSKQIGVEYIVGKKGKDGLQMELVNVHDLKLDNVDGSIASYKLEIIPTKPGIFDCGFRIYPKNTELAQRMDLSIVRWIT